MMTSDAGDDESARSAGARGSRLDALRLESVTSEAWSSGALIIYIDEPDLTSPSL